MVKSVSITDAQYRIAVVVAGLGLIVAMTALRWFGELSLAAKSPPPSAPSGTSSELLTRSSASRAVYLDLVARDAAVAGAPVPTLDELSRTLPYRVDEVRHVLDVGQPALEAAGVRLRAVRLPEGLGLEITNATGSDIAYEVATATIPATQCSTASILAFNAMTIRKGMHETRVECVWHDGIALAVTRIETVELAPLSAWYLDHVPPSVVGIEPRVARGHLAPGSAPRCASALSQAVRSGLERGEIGWRDLVDFYARHRCQTYQFSSTYRALKLDGERGIPAVSAGM
jgi:hypothetical protein